MDETMVAEVMEYICGSICQWPGKAASQTVLDEICEGCGMPARLGMLLKGGIG